MNPIIETALEVERFFKTKKWRYCFIGGMAVIRWGEPRFTQDVDLALLTGFGSEEKFIHDLTVEFQARIDVLEQFAVKNRVALLQSRSGVPIDVSLAGLPFEEKMIKRASVYEVIPNKLITTCSAEDLIVLKAFANRDKDWSDVRGVLIRQQGRLNTDMILSELQILVELKEEPEILTRLKELISKKGNYL
ncbi:MAG: hypothetical protein RBS57_18245 [Desulforhabdus sp.]|jgi:hypothetical protein|nr:hypothetical protein [Desulforhabdus sp.]